MPESEKPIADVFRSKTGFNQRVSVESVSDILYAMGSEELFRLLVVERGWSGDRWEAFVYSSVLEQFL